MFGRFKKSQEEKEKEEREKIIKELQAKKAALENLEKQKSKIKEEMIKMGKLALRDGKLEKVEEEKVVQTNNQQEPAGSPFVNAPSQAAQQPMPPVPEPQQAPQMPPPPAPEPQQAPQQPMQTQMPQQAPMQPQMPQQPQMQQSQIQQAPVQEPAMLGVVITLTNGDSLRVAVPEQNFSMFVQDIDTAIANNTTFRLGQQFISGRHILFYTLE